MPTHFTIYAYDAIKAEFERIEHLDFLFGKPTFIRQLDPNKPAEKAFISNNGSQGKGRIAMDPDRYYDYRAIQLTPQQDDSSRHSWRIPLLPHPPERRPEGGALLAQPLTSESPI